MSCSSLPPLSFFASVMEKGEEIFHTIIKSLEGWVWKDVPDDQSWYFNIFFVSFSTTLNMIILFMALYFWTVNRQTHFRSTRGSVITHRNEVDNFNKKRPLDQGDDEDYDGDDDDSPDDTYYVEKGEFDYVSDTDQSDTEQKVIRERIPKHSFSKRARRSYRKFVDYRTENDDDDNELSDYDETSFAKYNMKPVRAKVNTSGAATTPDPLSNQLLSPKEKNFLNSMIKTKIFSYLSEEAMKECLKYIEYIDVPIGNHVFGKNQFDGSLLCVVAGKVRVRFHDYPLEDVSNDSEKDDLKYCDGVLGYSSGPGTIVTPGLGLLHALVQEHARRNTNSKSNKRKEEAIDSRISKNVSAVSTARNTTIIRIAPHCFYVLMEKFPSDVHKIAQALVSRVQRVTVQFLVKILGLHHELLRQSSDGAADDYTTKEEEKNILKKSLQWNRLTKNLSKCNDDSDTDLEILASIKDDASVVAAEQLGIRVQDERKAVKDYTFENSVKLIRQQCCIIRVPAGQTLIQAGMKHDSFYLVLDGTIDMGIKGPSDSNSDAFRRYREFQRGSLIGRLPCFTDDVSILEYRSSSNDSGVKACTLLKIPKHVFSDLIITHPTAMTRCLDSFLNLISPVVYLLNWNSDWMHVEAAEVIARCGDPCNSMFIVLIGRIRANYPFHNANNSSHSTSPFFASFSSSLLPTSPRKSRKFEEYGRGKILGEVGGLTGSPWPCDVLAIRNSELARVPMAVLVAIIKTNPRAGLHFARMIASQVQSKYNSSSGGYGGRNNRYDTMNPRPTSINIRSADSIPTTPTMMPSYGLKLATIAIVPLSEEINLPQFCSAFVTELQQIAPSQLMTKTLARTKLGEMSYKHRGNSLQDVKMTRLLGDMEEYHRLVVYQADLKYTWWTKLCIQQADCILLLVNSDKAPEKRRVEKCLQWAYDSMHVRIELVVLQKNKSSPKPSDLYPATSSDKDDNQTGGEEFDDYMNDEDDEDDDDEDDGFNVSDQLNQWSEQRRWVSTHHIVRMPFRRHYLDFRRMCRRITGLSVGLVLGGGGARGLAHLGIIRALEEAGIIIDIIGGTSQGAFVGAIYARDPDHFDRVLKAARTMADSMASVMEKLLDLTLPLTSIFSGKRFNRGIRKSLGKTTRIQDLIVNFYCVSCDIQKREQVVHTKGILWKYVRASMSLTGYLPPISEDGRMLVDGGYMNVVPADIMRKQMNVRTVIAVDVSPEKERDYTEYGAYLSGWWLLWNSLNPFASTMKVPSMGDLSDALRWVSSDQHRKNVAAVTDLHLTPPIDEYGTLDYDKFDEIIDTGYQYAKPIVDEWVSKNPWIATEASKSDKKVK